MECSEDTFNVKPSGICIRFSYSKIRLSIGPSCHVQRINKGKFQLKTKDASKYILLIAHGSFADYVDDIELKNEDTEKTWVLLVYFSKEPNAERR
ncbi:MAG: hypothetical protein IPJ31_13055 [Bacteroidetes bacterium]|nr:hypothetical protein [Bacteroidota bacterium]